MNPSNSLEQKLLSIKDKISASKTNSIVRNRIKSIDLNKSRKGLLKNKTFLIKDNIAIKDEYLTCASYILESYKSPYNATVIDRKTGAHAATKGFKIPFTPRELEKKDKT